MKTGWVDLDLEVDAVQERVQITAPDRRDCHLWFAGRLKDTERTQRYIDTLPESVQQWFSSNKQRDRSDNATMGAFAFALYLAMILANEMSTDKNGNRMKKADVGHAGVGFCPERHLHAIRPGTRYREHDAGLGPSSSDSSFFQSFQADVVAVF